MKRLFTFALALAAIGSMSAQKQAVDQAAKLAGKNDKLTEARSLLKDAMQNNETANDARTYATAAKVEFAAFDADKVKGQIDPANSDLLKMGQELIAGYDYYIQTIPLDAQPNEKGQVKPRFTKEITNNLKSHQNDFFEVGANLFNAQHMPEAYRSFMIYADMPDMEIMGKDAPQTPDSIRTTAYYNAGLAAYFGNDLRNSAAAFQRSMETGYPTKEPYIYQIACWQNIAQNEEGAEPEAQAKIGEIARQGYAKFGLAEPLFLNNLVNLEVSNGKIDEAIATVNEAMAQNPDNAALYGLRGYIYDRAGKDDESLADYRKAASFDNADIETLKNAAKKILRTGQEKWNAIEGVSEEAQAARKDVRTNHFEAAQDITNRMKAMAPDDPEVANIIDSVEYMLSF